MGTSGTSGRKVLQNLFRASCLTSIAFVFQACYGTPEDMGGVDKDYLIQGVVINKNNAPVKGIKVSDANDKNTFLLTNYLGEFSLYTATDDNSSVQLLFEDIDGASNGKYAKQNLSITFDKYSDKVATVQITLKDAE